MPSTPDTQLDEAAVFRNDATATAALLSIYGRMEADGQAYSQLTTGGLSSDEMLNYSSSGPNIDLFSNNLTADNAIVFNLWRNWYKYIYQSNAILEGVVNNTSLSISLSKQLEGEARFIRAFCYFYLVNVYGGVPLVITTDYRTNASLNRSESSVVNQFIVTELEKAVELLSEDYLTSVNLPGTERVRANKSAARALLARQYLYMKRWAEAEAQASLVINHVSTYQLLGDVNKVFQKNSREAILQLQNQVPGYNSYPGAFLILTTVPNTEALDTLFVKSFESSDLRRTNWINLFTDGGQSYYFPFKYKIKQNVATISEYTMVLRLSEQYLIRAEARAMQDKLNDGESDLNFIRTRAGLLSVSGLSKFSLVDSIHQERRHELFAEFGDRWIDLKRIGKATEVLQHLKNASWQTSDTLYPIPNSERLLNNRLSQNPGY